MIQKIIDFNVKTIIIKNIEKKTFEKIEYKKLFRTIKKKLYIVSESKESKKIL